MMGRRETGRKKPTLEDKQWPLIKRQLNPVARKKSAGNLPDSVWSFSPDEELASAVEKVLAKDRGRLSDSLGSWKMSDEEADEIFSSLRRRWKESTVRVRSKTKNA